MRLAKSERMIVSIAYVGCQRTGQNYWNSDEQSFNCLCRLSTMWVVILTVTAIIVSIAYVGCQQALLRVKVIKRGLFQLPMSAVNQIASLHEYAEQKVSIAYVGCQPSRIFLFCRKEIKVSIAYVGCQPERYVVKGIKKLSFNCLCRLSTNCVAYVQAVV